VRWLVIALTLLAFAGSAATIALAYSVSAFVASVFDSKTPAASLLPIFLVSIAFKAIQAWLQEFLAVRAASSAKQQLRQLVVSASWKRADRASTELGLLAGRGLDALDPYFSKYLPQLFYAGIVTPVLVFVFWITDLASGLTLLVTLPLIPLFMVLIGWATAELQSKQFDSLGRLAGHFAEVLKAFGTLKLFGREKHQEKIIAEVSSDLRKRTMKVLRVSFLSGFTLELIASLSVALIAVSIGMRLVNAQISFDVALFLLILAPEAFLPLRAVGANFHASSEGLAAATKVLDYLEEAEAQVATKDNAFYFEPGLTLITGPSGIGKSSLFGELLGFGPDRQRFSWLGETPEVRREKVAWMPQQPKLTSGTVGQNVTGFSEQNSKFLEDALAFANIGQLLKVNAKGLSGGEAARVNLARAVYRLRLNGSEYLLADEPTASVDLATARNIRRNFRLLADSGVNVVVISHEAEYLELADTVIELA
jgi:ATP-binding cassette subfamily C protein CydD